MNLALIKSARIRINADQKSLAQNIADEISHRLSENTKVTAVLTQYKDDFHYEFTFSINLTAENYSDLEFKAFKLCTTISTGPWLYVNLPNYENEFEFEAIFNHEAFIHHSTEFSNKLKWAHLEIN